MRRPTDRTPLDPRGDRRQAGFTLVEMAIAVALFGMMVSGALMGLTVYFDRIAEEKSRDNLTKVERAIGLYVAVNGRLPCPDENADGADDDCTGAASEEAVQGAPPWLDLGLQQRDVLDGYQRFISYVVAVDLTTAGSLRCGMSYGDATRDTLIEPLDDPANDDWPADAPEAAYALIYHGENGRGAILPSGVQYQVSTNAEEAHNAQVGRRAQNGGMALQELAVASTTAGFDDAIRTRTPAQILFDNGCPNG